MKLKSGYHIQKAPKADSIGQKNIPISAWKSNQTMDCIVHIVLLYH
jgi:hypothetical protein